MLNSGTMPPSAVKLSCIALTAPQLASVVTVANSAEAATPKRTSLPSMLPPGMPSAWRLGLPAALRPIGEAGAGEEQHEHRGEDRPALPPVADRAAEHVRQPCAEREDRQHLDEVGPRARVLERVRRVGVEEAAAVGAEHLDRFLAARPGPRTSVCFAPSSVVATTDPAKVCGTPPRDQHERVDDRHRQQEIERDPRQVGPEVAERQSLRARAKPRITAKATAIPVAADRKLWTVSATIWLKLLIVLSPE